MSRKGKNSHACGKNNLFQAVCRSRQSLNNVTSDSSGQYFLGSLDESEGEEPPWRASLHIVNRVVRVNIDTREDVSLISELQWKECVLGPNSMLVRHN